MTPAASPWWPTSPGAASHDIVAKALTALCNLDHRGAKGSEPDTGDGAGILTQIPDAFFRAIVDFDAARGRRATRPAWPSCRRRRGRATSPSRMIEEIAAEEGLTVLGWREVPVDRTSCRAERPGRDAALLAAVRGGRRAASRGMELDRLAFCLRKRAEHEAGRLLRLACRARTIVYKGMLTTAAARAVLPRPVGRAATRARIALVHSRFSTNTFPSLAAGAPLPVRRAQRRDQHRQGQPQLDAGPRGDAARADLIPGDLDAALPDLRRRTPATRPASTRCLELLHIGGRSPAARGADDDPGGVGEPRPRWTRRGGPSTSSTPP